MPYAGGRLLSTREAADMLGEKEKWFRDNWRAWGITGYLVGRRWKFREHELQAWLESRKDSHQLRE